MKPVILFDIDGTLADTFDTSMHIAKKLAPHYHIPLLPDYEIEKLRHLTVREILRTVGIPWYRFPFFISAIRKELTNRMHKVKPFPGVKNVIKTLRQQGYELGIISSNSRKNVDIFLNENKFTAFHHIHAGIGMFSKPRALAHFKPHVIYIGDEVRDIEAARKAGIPIIAVTWGYSSKNALKQHHPDALVSSSEQLLAAIRRIALKSSRQ